jgi:hypothetical protein
MGLKMLHQKPDQFIYNKQGACGTLYGWASDLRLEGPKFDTRLGHHVELSTGLKGSSVRCYELLLDFSWMVSWETGG